MSHSITSACPAIDKRRIDQEYSWVDELTEPGTVVTY